MRVQRRLGTAWRDWISGALCKPLTVHATMGREAGTLWCIVPGRHTLPTSHEPEPSLPFLHRVFLFLDLY